MLNTPLLWSLIFSVKHLSTAFVSCYRNSGIDFCALEIVKFHWFVTFFSTKESLIKDAIIFREMNFVIALERM